MLRTLSISCMLSALVLAGCATHRAQAETKESADSGDVAALAERLDKLEAQVRKIAIATGTLPAEPVKQIGVKNETRNTWKCVEVKNAPAIDGKLNDDAWKKAVQVNLVSDEGKSLMNNTAVLICHDKEKLYIGAMAMEIKMDQLKITATKRDDKVYMDDCIEFYIDPELDRTDAVKFVVNPDGVFMDFMRDLDGDAGDVNWDADVKATKLEDRYIMEISIPLRDMGLKYKPGMRIGFNAFRLRSGQGKKGESSTWWGKCNAIASIGTVVFE